MSRSLRFVVVALVALATVPATAVAGKGDNSAGDTARYILPPGNFGGVPFTDESTDQLPLYDGLTPLRGNVTTADIDRLFLPEDFKPVGATREEQTGRPGLRLIYDSFGVPHIYGKTRDDVSFGAGWVTQRDRGLLIHARPRPGPRCGGRRAWDQRVRPGHQRAVVRAQPRGRGPRNEAERPARQDIRREGTPDLARRPGVRGRHQRLLEATNNNTPPATVNDVIAAAFIGSIFGAGGGGEAQNSELLAKLQGALGKRRGFNAWDDVMLADDPEAPTTTDRRFDYGPLTGGQVRGSVKIDPGSIQNVDPRATTPAAVASAQAPPARRQASNWLITAPERSAHGNPLAVMGPQLGYYYPEIVQQMHLSGPGVEAQGATVPGLAMYVLIGRTKNYAWSLTSAGHDVRDVYAERLCNPDGSAPTRASIHYRYKGKCRPFEDHNAGLLAGTPLRYKSSVHGSVVGTATVKGKLVALSRKRSTFGRDGLNLAALKDMTEGKASTPGAVLAGGEPVRLHVQLGLHLAEGDLVLLVRPAPQAAARSRPAAGHEGQRTLRVEGLPQ